MSEIEYIVGWRADLEDAWGFESEPHSSIEEATDAIHDMYAGSSSLKEPEDFEQFGIFALIKTIKYTMNREEEDLVEWMDD